MLKFVKNKIRFFKNLYCDIFLYPRETIDVDHSLNYDIYWKNKRGDKVGVLSDWQKARADIIINTLDRKTPISLGDIGCGEGSIIKYLQMNLNVTKSVGYDRSDFVLKKARANGMDIIKLDINNEKELELVQRADYILMLEVAEHVPHTEKLLDFAYQKADKGVFISFPNSGYFTYRLRLLFGKFPKQWMVFPNEHLRFWTGADLKWWLKALGYKEYKVYYYKGIPFLNKLWPALFAAAWVVYLEK